MTCFDFMRERYEVLLDNELPSQVKHDLIDYFLTKVDEECGNITIH